MKKILHSIKSLIIATVLILAGVNLNAQNICAATNTISPASIQNVCIGSPSNMLTATITTNGTGNNGNITYTWYSNTTNSTTGGTMVQTLSTTNVVTTNSFNPPASIAGTLWYYCSVTNDGGDCAGTSYTTAAVQVNVNSLPALFNVFGGGVRCSNGPGLSINISGSQTGVKYQLSTGGHTVGGALLGSTGHSFGFVAGTAGTYTMLATDATSGCSTLMNGSATIITNAAPSVSYTTTDVSCKGGDGTITVTGSGGTPEYLFNIDGGVFSSSTIFTGITSGNHSIGIKDANACAVNVTGINVQNAPPLSVSITSVNPGNCTGADGSITANRVGGIDDGITPVQFELGGDVTRAYQNSNVFGGLSKGNYTVTVKDSKGCTAVSSTVSLTQTAGTTPTTFNVLGGGTLCSGGTGVSINLSGSETGVNYQLQNNGVLVGTVLHGTTGSPLTFVSTSAGSYTILATNATAGCTSNMNGVATITVNPSPAIFQVSNSGVLCAGSTAIPIKLNGSETGVNYQLNNNGNPIGGVIKGNNGLPITFYTTSANIYKILATNATSGCTTFMGGSANTSDQIHNPPITPSYTKYYASSCKGGDGTITITTGGGTPGYMYSVDGKAFGTNNFLTGLAAGDHQIVIKDANGCTFTYPAITVLTAPIMKVQAGGANPGICTGNDGAVWATELGGDVDGITPLEYMLNGDVSRPFQTSSTFTGLPIGNYSVTIKDSKGCLEQSNVFTLNLGTAISLSAYSANVSSCGNGMDGRISTVITGGVAPYTYKINGSISSQTNAQYFEYSNLGVGNYTIEISDRSGCAVSKEFTITQANALTATVANFGDESCIGKNNGYITISPSGNGGVPSYSYSKDGGTIYQSSNSFINLSPATYSMVVKDSKGCISAPVSITVKASTLNCRIGNALDNGSGNRFGNSDENNNLSKTFNSSLSIQAYPNPFGSEFTLNVQGNNQDKVFITVTDILGRRLYQAEGSANQQYKLGSNLSRGIFIVQVLQGNNVQTIKIVKE